MAQSFASVGICRVQLDPVCEDGLPDLNRESVVFCEQITNITQTDRISDATPITLDGGSPGSLCFDIEIEGEELAPDLEITTCGLVNPLLDSIMSGGKTEVMVDDLGVTIGLRAASKDAQCFCSCDTGATACNRWAITTWSKAFCPGKDMTAPAEGAWAHKHWGNVEFRRQARTTSQTRDTPEQQTYSARAYESTDATGWAGPGNILAADPANAPYQACFYGPFLSDTCPPGDVCSCGGCDDAAITPLADGNPRLAPRTPIVIDDRDAGLLTPDQVG